MEIYVIRHSKVAIGKDICYGQSDVDLAADFHQTVVHYAKALPNDFDAVFSSPLARCRVLAEALNYGAISFDNALMEMNFGDWELKKWNDIPSNDLQKWMNDFVEEKTPNGESLAIVYERVKTFIESIKNKDYKKVLLVTHAGVIRCLWAYILEIPLQNVFRIPVNYEEVFAFQIAQNFMQIIRKQ